MVIFDNSFRARYADAVKKARAEKIRVVRLENGLYYAARRAEGHGRYLVQVDETKSGMFATCRTIRGASCPSYRPCVHLAAVFNRMIAEGHAITRKERAA